MSTCLAYLKKEVEVVSHAVKAHLWATAGIVLALYGVGTVLYHAYLTFTAIGG